MPRRFQSVSSCLAPSSCEIVSLVIELARGCLPLVPVLRDGFSTAVPLMGSLGGSLVVALHDPANRFSTRAARSAESRSHASRNALPTEAWGPLEQAAPPRRRHSERAVAVLPTWRARLASPAPPDGAPSSSVLWDGHALSFEHPFKLGSEVPPTGDPVTSNCKSSFIGVGRWNENSTRHICGWRAVAASKLKENDKPTVPTSVPRTGDCVDRVGVDLYRARYCSSVNEGAVDCWAEVQG